VWTRWRVPTGNRPPETVPGETKKSSGVSSGKKLTLTLKKRGVGEEREREILLTNRK
jgi:hypothetical protein